MKEIIDQLLQTVHPRLTAMEWMGEYYATVKNGLPSLHILSTPTKLRLDHPDWYTSLATKKGDTYQLLPNIRAVVDMSEALECLIARIKDVDQAFFIHISVNRTTKSARILTITVQELRYIGLHDKFIWHHKIFIHYGDCHRISPSPDYLVNNLREKYNEYLCAKPEHQGMCETTLRQAHHENAT